MFKTILEMLKSKTERTLLLIFGILAAVIILIVIFAVKGFIDKGRDTVSDLANNTEYEAKVEFTVTQLQEVFEISEISTASYIYNSIATAYTEDGKEARYHVYYEGTIKAGVDFGKIDIQIDDAGKVITLTLPEVEIHDIIVDSSTLDYIFSDEKYNTETGMQEAYSLCYDDLTSKIENEKQFYEMAKNNAVNSVEALIVPWVEQVDDEYVVIVK